MSQQIIDSDTIEAMNPLLSRIGDDLADVYVEVAQRMAARPSDDYVEDLAGALDRVQAYVTEFERLGGTIRSYEPVEVDFIAESGGAIGYIVWQRAGSAAGRFVSTVDLCAVGTEAA